MNVPHALVEALRILSIKGQGGKRDLIRKLYYHLGERRLRAKVVDSGHILKVELTDQKRVLREKGVKDFWLFH